VEAIRAKAINDLFSRANTTSHVDALARFHYLSTVEDHPTIAYFQGFTGISFHFRCGKVESAEERG
jgi:hypothetical protein